MKPAGHLTTDSEQGRQEENTKAKADLSEARAGGAASSDWTLIPRLSLGADLGA